MKKLILLSFLLSLSVLAQEVTPTQRLNQSVDFSDDLEFENLDLAIDRQLASYKRIGLSGSIKFGSKVYPKTILRDSLILLKNLAAEAKRCLLRAPRSACQQEFSLAVNESFALYQPVPSRSEPGYRRSAITKFTSYYSPDISGSRTRSDRFKHAIYRLPTNPAHRNFTRVDIDMYGALEGKGYELFWVEDSLFDLYLLHVQGGGRVRIHNPDGSVEMSYLSYEGRNSQPFRMIYHYMLAQGYLKPGETGIVHQRRFLEENPDKAEEIFRTTPSYIYFRESADEPVGVNNIPLTERRSLAIDNRIYKTMGLINFVKTIRATSVDAQGNVLKTPFSRFFISQDTGGAIRGNARCDLYFGYGPDAELTAYNMNDMGEQYFLIKK